jgi:LmbE family N-acetylglucosaminyl deacetylase
MRTLCTDFAHPDDESFSAGGTLAHYADARSRIASPSAQTGDGATNKRSREEPSKADAIAAQAHGELLDLDALTPEAGVQ